MEQWNIEEKNTICRGWCDYEIYEYIFKFLTAVGLNKKESSLLEVLKELYLIEKLKGLKIGDIEELTDYVNSISDKGFENVINVIEEKYKEINSKDYSEAIEALKEYREKLIREENRNIEEIKWTGKVEDRVEKWENFYSNRKKDLWTIIDVVTGEKRPEVAKYEFSLKEKIIFWEILSDEDRKVLKALKKFKRGNSNAMHCEEIDIVAELLKTFETKDIGKKMNLDSKKNYDRIERVFYKSYLESMDAVESLKDAVMQCKKLIDYDKKYIDFLYEVEDDIYKIKAKVDKALFMNRMELNIRKNNLENKENQDRG